MSCVAYRLEVVGGPYDAVPGFHWADGGGNPPPERIWIGRCDGDGACRVEGCLRFARPHVAFWAADEDLPVGAIEYERESIEVGDEPDDDRWRSGTALYVMGGLPGWPRPSAEVREPVPAGVLAQARPYLSCRHVFVEARVR